LIAAVHAGSAGTTRAGLPQFRVTETTAACKARYGKSPRTIRRGIVPTNATADDVKGFEVLPRRWVVERTFAWLGRYKRLVRDYELCPEHSESMIYVAMTQLLLKRLAL